MNAFVQIVPFASLAIAFATVLVTAWLMTRQVRAMEHERNAMALLEAIDRISSQEIIQIFKQLDGINGRYPTDDDLRTNYPGSDDEHALLAIGQYIETVATLARRGVLSASLIVDSVGYLVRKRWNAIAPFVARERIVYDNPYLFENFEWLARYSEWWKDEPRPPRDPNYWPDQFERGKAQL